MTKNYFQNQDSELPPIKTVIRVRPPSWQFLVTFPCHVRVQNLDVCGPYLFPIFYHIEVLQSLSLSVNQPSSRVMLWSPSYYIGTAGHVSAEVIEKYIQGQQMKMKRNSC